MSDKMQEFNTAAVNLYVLLINRDTEKIACIANSAMEAVGTWNNTRLDQCDIPLTAQGPLYSAAVPVWLPVGNYVMLTFTRSGASPAVTDVLLRCRDFIWDGSDVFSLEAKAIWGNNFVPVQPFDNQTGIRKT